MIKRTKKGSTWGNPNFVRSAAGTRLANSLLLGRRLRRKARTGLAMGTFLIELPCSATLHALAIAGFDFVVLDLEHSAIDFSTLQRLIDAAHAAGLATLARPLSGDAHCIGKILDLGANGVMVPHVDSVDKARRIAEQAHFPPRGQRSFSPISRFDALRDPLRALDHATYVVVQVEGRSGLEQISDIASVPGVDAVFVGPYDLALSLDATPGSPQVFAAARKAVPPLPDGVAMGIYVDDPSLSGNWAESGFRLQCISFDGRMLADGARSVVERARNGTRKRERAGRKS
jgi:2-keto-3-deoxy-L-rhamnonate aldolase RhmA